MEIRRLSAVVIVTSQYWNSTCIAALENSLQQPLQCSPHEYQTVHITITISVVHTQTEYTVLNCRYHELMGLVDFLLTSYIPHRPCIEPVSRYINLLMLLWLCCQYYVQWSFAVPVNSTGTYNEASNIWLPWYVSCGHNIYSVWVLPCIYKEDHIVKTECVTCIYPDVVLFWSSDIFEIGSKTFMVLEWNSGVSSGELSV